MSDEVRSNSSPTPPEAGGRPVDPVDGPNSLDIEFPTPDIDLVDSGPVAGPVNPDPDVEAGGVTVLPNKDISSLRPQVSSDPSPPRSSERPPPPSQRVAHPQRFEAMVTPIPPSPSAAKTLPVPSASEVTTLPAPAAVLVDPPASADDAELSDAEGWPDPGPASVPAPLPELAPKPPPAAPPPDPVGPTGFSTEPAPAARMLSEPVPLVKPAAGSVPVGSVPVDSVPVGSVPVGSVPAPKVPAPKVPTLRPGLVEPKRIIEVLGSNVPVLDSALEEEAIEDLDESEAHELSETPLPEAAPVSVEAELELNVVVEDFPPSLEVVSVDDAAPAGDRDEDALSGGSPGDGSAGGLASSDASLDGPESPGRRVKAPPNKRRRPPPPSSRSSEMRKVEPPLPPGARKWWEEMFSEEFLRAIPILSPKQLEREVRFIDEALAVARGGRILDLACGAGQHAVELATRGYDLVGYDLSQSQLDWAGGLAQERNQRLQFTYGDMRELSYNEAFDAIYSWNTSFGFFEEEKNLEVAQRIFRALRPGGRFLLDVINRDFVVAQQPGQTWFEGDGCVCIDDVSIDFITSRMKVKRTLMLTTGKNRECNYSVRIYGLHELGKILHDVGFKVLNVSGRPEMQGVFFGATSPRIIILAVKP